MYANYHTHTVRCHHAVDEDEAYVRQAIARGIQELGFSDHAPLRHPDGSQASFRVPMEQAQEYVDSLRALRDKYRDRITLHIGFEMEYCPGYFESMLSCVKEFGAEYLILGQHFLADAFPNAIVSAEDGHTPAHLTTYVDNVIAAMKTGKFLYVAHPDLLRYDTGDPFYRTEMTRLCTAARDLHVPLEINMLGLGTNRHYPNDAFWTIAGEVGCLAVIGCDAHEPGMIGHPSVLAAARKLAVRHGLTVVERLPVKGL